MGVKNSKSEQAIEHLNEEQLHHLAQTTGYSKDSVLKYYKSFLIDCPCGKLPKEQFKKMYRQLYPHSKSDKFCARIFTIFDRNKDNFLDFEEFLRAIKITMSNNVKDKLKCAFEIYDLKGDGKIDKKEMKKILNHIYDMLGEDNKQLRHRSKFADKKVDLIFEKFDLDRDESLSLDEFISGCLRDEYLNHLFKSSFSVESTKSLSSESLALNDSNRELVDKSSMENGERKQNNDEKSVKFEIMDHDDNKDGEDEEEEKKSIKLKYLNKIEVYK